MLWYWVLWTNACWEQTARWVSTVMRGRVEVSTGDSGRVGIRRESVWREEMKESLVSPL